MVAPNINGIRFTTLSVNRDSFGVNELSANALNCFCAGTRIATANGDIAVEDVLPGMRLRTADGGETNVQWLGRQEIAPRFVHPAKINPICISAGAIADDVPARNLFVSPDHAIEIDGVLINASALVNGSTIYQVAKMPLDGFTY